MTCVKQVCYGRISYTVHCIIASTASTYSISQKQDYAMTAGLPLQQP